MKKLWLVVAMSASALLQAENSRIELDVRAPENDLFTECVELGDGCMMRVCVDSTDATGVKVCCRTMSGEVEVLKCECVMAFDSQATMEICDNDAVKSVVINLCKADECSVKRACPSNAECCPKAVQSVEQVACQEECVSCNETTCC